MAASSRCGIPLCPQQLGFGGGGGECPQHDFAVGSGGGGEGLIRTIGGSFEASKL